MKKWLLIIFLSFIITGCGQQAEVRVPKVTVNDLNLKNSFIVFYDKDFKLMNNNIMDIKREFKNLIKYMNVFHSYIKYLSDNITSIKAGKMVASFLVPKVLEKLIDNFTKGVVFLKKIDNEILIYIKSSDKSHIKILIDSLDKFRKNPNNLKNEIEVQSNIIRYVFYMNQLKNNLSNLIEIVESIYNTYQVISKALNVDGKKDILGLQKDIKAIRSIILKNEKLINTNIKIVNEIGAIVIVYSKTIEYEKNKECLKKIDSSCSQLLDIYLNNYFQSAGSYASYYRKKYLKISCQLGNIKACEILKTLK